MSSSLSPTFSQRRRPAVRLDHLCVLAVAFQAIGITTSRHHNLIVHLKRGGLGFQIRINDVLRIYVTSSRMEMEEGENGPVSLELSIQACWSSGAFTAPWVASNEGLSSAPRVNLTFSAADLYHRK